MKALEQECRIVHVYDVTLAKYGLSTYGNFHPDKATLSLEAGRGGKGLACCPAGCALSKYFPVLAQA